MTPELNRAVDALADLWDAMQALTDAERTAMLARLAELLADALHA